MKRLSAAFRVLALATLVASCDSATASGPPIMGRWNFTIPVSRYGYLDIQQSGSTLSGTGIYDYVHVSMTGSHSGSNVTVKIGPTGGARQLEFSGKMENDSTISGTWSGSFEGNNYPPITGVIFRPSGI